MVPRNGNRALLFTFYLLGRGEAAILSPQDQHTRAPRERAASTTNTPSRVTGWHLARVRNFKVRPCQGRKRLHYRARTVSIQASRGRDPCRLHATIPRRFFAFTLLRIVIPSLRLIAVDYRTFHPTQRGDDLLRAVKGPPP